MAKRYRTTKDIVISAGTEVDQGPTRTLRFVPFVEAILAVTKDSTATWSMPLDEAIKNGLVEAVE